MDAPCSIPKLFSPIQLGDLKLAHRIVMAPLTRYRANLAHVHGDMAVEYYSQRASVPGGLIITEATFIAQKAGGERNVPGIWSDAQVAAWKRVCLPSTSSLYTSLRIITPRSPMRFTLEGATSTCSFGPSGALLTQKCSGKRTHVSLTFLLQMSS